MNLKKRTENKMVKGIKSSDKNELVVKRAKLNSLNLYEITEDELENLSRGGPDPIFLNFAIFCLSIAISLSVTIFTTQITSDRTFMIFTVITILGFLCGFVLLTIWWKSRISVGDLITKIKDRMINQK